MAVTGWLAATATATLGSALAAVHIALRAPRRVETGDPSRYGLAHRQLHIPARGRGRGRLFAWLLPVEAPSATVIVLHGWGGNAEMMLPLALPFHAAGMNVLLFDARNHGRSDRAPVSSLPQFAADVDAAVDWVRLHTHDPPGRIVLLGHSVGGGAVLFAASRRQDIAAVISVSAFAHPEAMMRRYLSHFGLPRWTATAVLRYVELVIRHRYDEIAPVNTVCRVSCPVLLVHGTDDTTVPVSDARTIRDRCPDRPPELLLIDGAGHYSVDAVEQHGGQLVGFLEKTLGFGPPRIDSGFPGTSERPARTR